MRARGQSAIEMLTTYGWAILIIIIAVSILLNLGLFGANKAVTSSCLFTGEIMCRTAILNTSGGVALEILQATDRPIRVTALRCTQENDVNFNDSDWLAIPIYLPSGERALVTDGMQFCYEFQAGRLVKANGSVGDAYKGKIFLEYEEVDTGIKHVATADVVMKYERVPLPTPPPTPFMGEQQRCRPCEYCEPGFGTGASCAPSHCRNTSCGSPSTSGSQCLTCNGAGACCGGSTPYCSKNTCVQCSTDAQCDDSNPCTTHKCASGTCLSSNVGCGSEVPGCSGANACTGGATCAPKAGLTSACTCSGLCLSGICSAVQPRTCVSCTGDAECNDQKECTTDACVSGTCVYTSRGCGASCEGTKVCDAAGGCNSQLSDGSACTCARQCSSGQCSPATNTCGSCASDAECVDPANPCNSGACIGGVCSHASVVCGEVTGCSGTNACNSAGSCSVKAANGAACSCAGMCASGVCSGGTCSPGGFVFGIVRDTAGNPLADVAIAVSGPSNCSNVTAAQGAYSCGPLAPGTYSVSASKPRYSASNATGRQVAALLGTQVDFALDYAPPSCAPNWVVSRCGCVLDVPHAYTLAGDLHMGPDESGACISIVSAANGSTLDCQNRFINGFGQAAGIILGGTASGNSKSERITVTRCNVRGFANGIVVADASNSAVSSSNVTDSAANGITNDVGSSVTITGNWACLNPTDVRCMYLDRQSGNGNTYTTNQNCPNVLEGAIKVCSNPDRGYVHGYVTDSLGNPIRAATVSGTNPLDPLHVSCTNQTDDSGYYVCNGVYGGSFTLTAGKTSYPAVTKNGIAVPGHGARMDFTLTAIPIACNPCFDCEMNHGSPAACQPDHCIPSTCGSSCQGGVCDGQGACLPLRASGSPCGCDEACLSGVCQNFACASGSSTESCGPCEYCDSGTPSSCLSGHCRTSTCGTACASGGTVCNAGGSCIVPLQNGAGCSCPEMCQSNRCSGGTCLAQNPLPACASGGIISSCPCTLSTPYSYALASNLSSAGTCVTLTGEANGSTLDCRGYTITGPGGSGPYNAVDVQSASRITVTNCRATRFLWGLNVEAGSDHVALSNNTLYNNTECGLQIYTGSTACSVSGNTASGNGQYGICVSLADGNTVENNSADNNGARGIHVYAASNNTISNNRVANNSESGIFLGYSSNNNSVTGNTATAGSGYGIRVYSASVNNRIGNNLACGNLLSDITCDSGQSGTGNTCTAPACSGVVCSPCSLTSGTIYGTVKNQSGSPLAGASVTATSGPSSCSTTTNAQGAYSCSSMQFGSYSLQAYRADYLSASSGTVSISALAPNLQLNFSLGAYGFFFGIVRDNLNNPVSGATITVSRGSSSFTVMTDAGGNYNTSGTNSSAGEYNVSAAKSWYGTANSSAATGSPSGSGKNVNFSLSTPCTSMVSACGSAITSSGYYCLSRSLVTSAGTGCIAIGPGASGVATLDCRGNALSGNGNGIGVNVTASNVRVVNCDVKNFSYGISLLSPSGSVNITNNTVRNCSIAGIRLTGSAHRISANSISANAGTGILLNASTGNVISGNTVTSSARGIYFVSNSNGNNVSSNTFSSNAGNGIELERAATNNFTGNTVRSNAGSGVNVSGYRDEYNVLVSNTVCGNTVNDIYCAQSNSGTSGDLNTCATLSNGCSLSGVRCPGHC